jgi:lipid-A-disaccharide synthase
VIDSPALHLSLAGRAQAAGVPVLYYVAPQMWAWGAHRIHKLRNRVEQLAVIFPFEEKYFRDQGVSAEYVGHPLAEQITSSTVDEKVVGEMRARGSPVVALLPGSRKHVVKEVFPGQVEVARQISARMPGAAFGVSVANRQVAPLIEVASRDAGALVVPYPSKHGELIRASDLVLVASGTTTLEVAFHRRPMIVMYNASRVFYHLIGRWMIRTPHLSLPNILAGREIVPEFMPFYTSTRPIADRALELLGSGDARETMVRELDAVVEPLRQTRASERTARMLLEMIDRSRH